MIYFDRVEVVNILDPSKGDYPIIISRCLQSMSHCQRCLCKTYSVLAHPLSPSTSNIMHTPFPNSCALPLLCTYTVEGGCECEIHVGV